MEMTGQTDADIPGESTSDPTVQTLRVTTLSFTPLTPLILRVSTHVLGKLVAISVRLLLLKPPES